MGDSATPLPGDGLSMGVMPLPSTLATTAAVGRAGPGITRVNELLAFPFHQLQQYGELALHLARRAQ